MDINNDFVEFDLIYDRSVWSDIKAKFPNAVFKDASDFIHESRFSVSIPDTTYKEFYRFLLDKGFHELSLQFQLLLIGQDDQEFNKMIDEWLEENKEGE